MPATPSGMRELRGELVAAVLERRITPSAFRQDCTHAADAWLDDLLNTAADQEHTTIDGLALVAVGGYGRSELCPGSDLDVVLVHAKRRRIDSIAQRIWYAIWDSGIKLDHSVRTPKEAVAVARDDQRAALGLLDGRVVTGDAALAEPMLAEIRQWWQAHAPTVLPALSQATAERHRRFGEVPFLLEPDLKESAGGLRDLEALSLAARAVPTLAAALTSPVLEPARSLLLDTRVVLHARAGGSSDRLLLQEQDEIAAVLGHTDADELMRAISEAGREVMWASADAWRRIGSAIAGPAGRSGTRDVVVAPGVVVRDGEIALDHDARPDESAACLLRVAVAAAARDLTIARATLDRLAAETKPSAEPWDDELRDELVSLLEYGASATPVLEALDQRHLLELLLPEWAHVRHRPQRNAYHRYTVDRHLLETVAEAARLVRDVPRPDLLLLGALLHDIGKGMPGDHSEAGAQVARTVAERIGLDEEDTAVLERVVRLHLLVPEVATRRDLDDPATLESVMKAVGTRLTLGILGALAEADSIATGPAAWGAWKEGLVRELVARVDARFRGDAPLPLEADRITDHEQELMAAGRLAAEIDRTTVLVVAPDRPGLFSVVAGTLALHRLDVKQARVSGDGRGMALERFRVERDAGRPTDARRLQEDLDAALDGRLLLEARLRTLEEAYARARPVGAPAPAVRVIVDQDASARATVVEVRTADSHGLLHRLTRALAELGLDVVSAKVSTLGHEVVDSFYVRDATTGDKVADDLTPELVAALQRAAEPT